jgi:putative nucleotidyltransferase with HDIG domain
VLPDIATEALRMANDPNVGAAQLAKIVDRSPQVGGRFISLANSAFYGRGAKMLSTHAAIVRLGLGGTRDLILQIVYEQSSSGLPRYHEQVARSLHRSVLAAITARTVCWELRQRYDHAYLAGLLHDIGESRIYRILADLPVPAEGTAEVEDLVRRYHARAGAEVITAWSLPADIAETCAMHHENDENPSLHVKVTMISDKLVDIVQSPSSNGVSSVDLERLAKLGIAEGRALALIQATREVAKAM